MLSAMICHLSALALLCASTVSAAPSSSLLPLERRATPKPIYNTSVMGYTDNTGLYSWIVPVTIRGQVFALEVDTGSDTLWVWSNQIPAASLPQGGNGNHSEYDIAAAQKAKPSRVLAGQTFNISYLSSDTATTGLVINDSVSIAGLSTQMNFGAALNLAGDFFYTDGLLGLGFPLGNELKPANQSTFLQAIQPQLDSPVFTTLFQLNNNGGSLGFGSVDPTYQKDLHKVPIDNSTGLWAVRNMTFTAKGKGYLQDIIYFDLGSPTMSLSNDTVNAYWATVSGAKRINDTNWAVPCNAKMPDLNFTSANEPSVQQSVPGGLLVAAKISWWGSSSTPMCYGALATAICLRGCSTVGAPFFASHYAVFNWSEPSVSFALQKNATIGTAA